MNPSRGEGGGECRPAGDARVLPVKYDADGTRYRDFNDAHSACQESHFADWVCPGPRSAPWVGRFMAKRNGPMSHDTRWALETRLLPESHDRIMHTFLSKVYAVAMEYDQVDCTNLACMELVLRQLQVIEERNKDRIISGSSSDASGSQQEYQSLMSTSGDAQYCMCPALKEYLASEVGKAMLIDKERRKAREERELARQKKPSKPAKGGGGGGDHRTFFVAAACLARQVALRPQWG